MDEPRWEDLHADLQFFKPCHYTKFQNNISNDSWVLEAVPSKGTEAQAERWCGSSIVIRNFYLCHYLVIILLYEIEIWSINPNSFKKSVNILIGLLSHQKSPASPKDFCVFCPYRGFTFQKRHQKRSFQFKLFNVWNAHSYKNLKCVFQTFFFGPPGSMSKSQVHSPKGKNLRFCQYFQVQSLFVPKSCFIR
jgi:hypothetical protein